ncbi:P-selectin glycoprotein ligand 1 isoform X2 [Ornithorhynchus anatinus]|nr:P-selectin glycoprotein ligand 1 isoform X2 [Ornithorhynchus anatinus]
MSVSRMALLLLLLLTQMACGAGLPTDQNRWNWKSGPGTQAPARSRRDIMTVMTPEEDTDYHFTFQTEGPEVLVNNTHASAPPTPAGTESVEPPTTGGPDPGETAETSSPVIATLNTSAGQPGPSVVPGEPHSELPTATSMPASSSVTFDPSSLPIAPTDPSSEPTGHPDDSTLSDRPTARDPSSSDPPDTTGPSSEPTGPPDNLAHSDSTTAGDPSTAPPNTTSPSSEPTGPLDNLTPSDSTAASDPSSAPTSANGPSSAPTPTLIPTKDPSPEHPTSIEPGKAPAPTAATRAPTSPVQKKTVQPGLYFRQTRATGPPGPEETSPPPAQAPSGGSIPVRQCLLAILILALIATTFLVCTVVLAVRLSRQLHTYPLRSSYSTEMVCISSLLPDGEGAAGANGAIGGPARNRAPAPTLGRGRAEDCEGDDLTLHSFLPEQ